MRDLSNSLWSREVTVLVLYRCLISSNLRPKERSWACKYFGFSAPGVVIMKV